MFKKIALGLVLLFLIASAGLYFWARSILTTDTVRTALAAQLSKSIGQPVTVEGVSATIYPRVTVTLRMQELKRMEQSRQRGTAHLKAAPAAPPFDQVACLAARARGSQVRHGGRSFTRRARLRS